MNETVWAWREALRSETENAIYDSYDPTNRAHLISKCIQIKSINKPMTLEAIVLISSSQYLIPFPSSS
jgi:hypothetical protein